MHLLLLWRHWQGGGGSGGKLAGAVVKARCGLGPAAARRELSIQVAVQDKPPLRAALLLRPLLLLEWYRCCGRQYVQLNQQRLELR